MIHAEIFTKAIAAHSNWKARLRSAISSGTSEFSPSQVRVDNACEFGKWLYGTELSAADKKSEGYRTVKQLHAQFHAEAGKVLEAALSGDKQAAEESLGVRGRCGKVATELTQATMKWRDSCAKAGR